MRLHAQGDRQSADRAEVLLRPRLVSLPEQSFVPELCRTLLAYPLVLLAMGLLAVHTAVFDEVAGGAVLELDGVAPVLAAVGAGFVAASLGIRHANHCRSRLKSFCSGEGGEGRAESETRWFCYLGGWRSLCSKDIAW